MPNRYLCAVFDDMRAAHDLHNYSYLLALIEEAQWIGNRMEAAIEDINDIRTYQEERSRLRKQIKDARAELKDIRHKIKKKKRKIEEDNDLSNSIQD